MMLLAWLSLLAKPCTHYRAFIPDFHEGFMKIPLERTNPGVAISPQLHYLYVISAGNADAHFDASALLVQPRGNRNKEIL